MLTQWELTKWEIDLCVHATFRSKPVSQVLVCMPHLFLEHCYASSIYFQPKRKAIGFFRALLIPVSVTISVHAMIAHLQLLTLQVCAWGKPERAPHQQFHCYTFFYGYFIQKVVCLYIQVRHQSLRIFTWASKPHKFVGSSVKSIQYSLLANCCCISVSQLNTDYQSRSLHQYVVVHMNSVELELAQYQCPTPLFPSSKYSTEILSKKLHSDWPLLSRQENTKKLRDNTKKSKQEKPEV